jgi:DNA polymerase family B
VGKRGSGGVLKPWVSNGETLSGKSGLHKPRVVVPVQIKGAETILVPKPELIEKVKFSDYPFIAWDGEAPQDTGYSLLGCSTGEELCSPNLRTEEMLQFILDTGCAHRKSFHIGYVFDYDVNNILCDLPWQCLIMLKERSRCQWKGWHIEHVPGKSFVVRKDGKRVRIEDIFSYFRLPYCTGDDENPGALDKYSIGTAELRRDIAAGKADRPDFVWAKIDSIRDYFRKELATMPPLMEKVREACYSAKMHIGAWYGPGALAKYELSKHHMERHLAKGPSGMSMAVRTAYAGGWFERFKCGYYLGDVYTADLNSAYAYIMSILPSLANGEWRYVEGERARDYTNYFGVFRVLYGTDSNRAWQDFMRSSRGIPLPLFQRGAHGNISHPFQNRGWYWNFEARNVAGHKNVEFLGGWIFEPSSDEMPFEWVEGAFDARLILQEAGDPAEKALKWMLASLYGTLAQRTGWDRRKRTAPRWHQLEYAGAITSGCRALMYRAAMPVALKGGLVSIDTDGIISTVPFETLPGRGEGNGLGQWKCEQYTGIIYFQNGIYWLRNMQGDWEPPKTRGIPRGKIGDPRIAIEALQNGGKLALDRRNFVGYGAAIHRRDRSEWRTWQDSTYEIDVNFAGSRQHVRKICSACNKGLGLHQALHDLTMSVSKDQESSPHKLPWLEEDDEWELQERIRHEIESHEVNEVFY